MDTQTSTARPAATKAACGTCVYWKAESEHKGECRRHAPQTIAFRVDDAIKYESHFPEVKATDWCGDFKVLSR